MTYPQHKLDLPTLRKQANHIRQTRADLKAVAGLHAIETTKQAKIDAVVRLAERAPDNRGFTARLMGDPRPAESALAKKHGPA